MDFNYLVIIVGAAAASGIGWLLSRKFVGKSTLTEAYTYGVFLVHAAEEAFPVGTIGREKFDFAVEMLLKRADISEAEAEVLINAAVSGLRANGIKPMKAAPAAQTVGMGAVEGSSVVH